MGHTLLCFCGLIVMFASRTHGHEILKTNCLPNTSKENDVLLRMKQLEMAFISQQTQMLGVIREFKSEVKADLSGKTNLLSDLIRDFKSEMKTDLSGLEKLLSDLIRDLKSEMKTDLSGLEKLLSDLIREFKSGMKTDLSGLEKLLTGHINTTTQIRLVNGTNSNSGRVEIYLGGVWGTVCDDNFDITTAKSVCKTIGLPYGNTEYKHNAYFGKGNGSIWLDDVQCSTVVRNFPWDCSMSPVGVHNCGHHEDVGVICK